MKVRDVMTREVVTVRPDTPLRELARVLSERRISGVPVVDDDGDLVGVISEADLVAKQAGRAVSQRSAMDWIFGEQISPDEVRRHSATMVAQAMSSPVVTIGADAALSEAAAVMVDQQVNRLPVIDQSRLVGIITRADFVHAYLRRDEEAARTIREDVLRRTMWLDPRELQVEVHDGTALIAGKVDRRSTAIILEKLLGIVEGVDRVESMLTWEFDDSAVTVPAGGEPEPGAASLLARQHPRLLHG